MKSLNLIYRGALKLRLQIEHLIGRMYTIIYILTYDIKADGQIDCFGKPVFRVIKNGKIRIGTGLRLNSSKFVNIIGRFQRCYFIVKGELMIGNNVGISSTTIICQKKITIEDNVKIGGNTIIYDTDFHSINQLERNSIPEITSNIKTAPVIICENAFIGAHVIILKGVRIGRNSIVGAGSVVTKDIPDNQVWGGNPAKLIKNLNEQ